MATTVIGLGAGSMVAHARKGDTFRFYEINPQVLDLAKREFTFLTESPAKIEAVLGDGRLSLEREPSQQFDVLVQEYGLAAVLVSDTPHSEEEADYWRSATDQILVTSNRRLLESAQMRDAGKVLVVQLDFRVWTDDYNSLWGVLK